MMYTYYVPYFFTTAVGGWGMGKTYIERETPIQGNKDVESITDLIKSQNPGTDIIVLSWTLLEKPYAQ